MAPSLLNNSAMTKTIASCQVRTATIDLRALTDLDLLGEVLARSNDAWNEFVRRFRGLIYRCVSKVICKYESVLASEDINEIFAEVLFNLMRDDMRKLRAYDPNRGSKLGSWIGLLSINTAYDYLRVTTRRPILDRIDGAPEGETTRDPLDDVLEKERWVYLEGMLKDFSERDRDFVALYYGSGMEPEQIAEKMQISIKTVYSKKNKIRNRLVSLVKHAPPDSPIALAA